MNTFRTRRAVLAAALVSTLVASVVPAAARAHSPDPALSGASWPRNQRLEYRWRAGAEPPARIKAAINAAAGDSNDTKNSQAAVFAYVAGGANPIGYGPGATCGVNGIGCFTRTAPNGGFTMWLREHGRVFEWGVLRWCQMLDAPANGCYDAENIVLDELGHIQGLQHHVNHNDDSDYVDAVVQEFSRTRPKAGWNAHAFGRCDVARLQLRYDVPNTASLISTCLDLDTTLSISASPSAVAYGGTTTLTATLKVVDLDAYGQLGGNPVTGRTVKLQRRPVGSTTWTTIATMSKGSASGTYTHRIAMAGPADFRATYATPSNEGINGSTSGAVRVNAPTCNPKQCPLSLAVR